MLSISQAARYLGVATVTLRRWDTQGKLSPLRTCGNHRRYSLRMLQSYLGEPDEIQAPSPNGPRLPYVYGRVSGYLQKKEGNLARQIQVLQKAVRQHYGSRQKMVILEEQGSGLNSTRPKLRKLMRAAQQGKVAAIFITYQDRLTRFGYAFLEQYFRLYDVPIHCVFGDQQHYTLEAQLLEDFLALMAVFSGRLYKTRALAQTAPARFQKKCDRQQVLFIHHSLNRLESRLIDWALTSA